MQPSALARRVQAHQPAQQLGCAAARRTLDVRCSAGSASADKAPATITAADRREGRLLLVRAA